MRNLIVIISIIILWLPLVCIADINYSLNFDGLDDFLDCDSDSIYEPIDALTLEAWVFLDTLYAEHSVISKLGNTDNPYSLYASSTQNAIVFSISISGDSIHTRYDLSVDITPYLDQWNHIAGTYDDENMKLYVNGVLVDSLPVSGEIEYFSGGNLYIGADDDDEDTVQDHIWNNRIDEIRLWETSRSNDDIEQSMNYKLSGNETGLIGYWRLDEGTGDTAYDLSPYGHMANLGSIVGPDIADPGWTSSAAPVKAQRWYISTTGNDQTGDGSELNPLATIQKGIDLAVDYDSIMIATGLYTGEGNRDIATFGKGLTIIGTFDTDSTIIDGTGAYNGINLNYHNYSVGFLTIENIIMINCTRAISAIPYLAPYRTISCNNCRFSGNSTVFDWPKGSPILLVDSCMISGNGAMLNEYDSRLTDEDIRLDRDVSFSVSNSQILNNSLVYTDEGYFPHYERFFENCRIEGNYLVFDAGCMVDNCMLENNGTVFYLRSLDHVVISNSTIEGCTYQIGHVGGSSESEAMLNFENCLIFDNVGGIEGAGTEASIRLDSCLYARNTGSIYIEVAWGSFSINHSTLVENYTTPIVSGFAISPFIGNCIIANNAGAGYICLSDTTMINYTITCNDFYDNQAGNFIGIADQVGTNGNISIDPRFCFPDTGNYYLHDISPCSPSNNDCNKLIGRYGTDCIYENRIIYVSTTGNDITGDGSYDLPYATIRKGITRAVDSDTVMLMPGTYTGDGNRDIIVNDRNLVINSISGASGTIIDCEASEHTEEHFGFKFIGSENSSNSITGLSIVNSYNEIIGGNGGAIQTNSVDLSIDNCVFVNNNAFNDGGAVFCLNADVTIKHSFFLSNYSAAGGAIMSGLADITIEDCIFEKNAGVGGGLYASMSDVSIEKSMFYGNTTFGIGGSAICNDRSDINLNKCIIANNVGTTVLIYPQDTLSCYLFMNNSVLSDNDGECLTLNGDSSLFEYQIQYSNLSNNSGGNYVGIPDQTGINGNISTDPLFIGGEPYDYHFQLGSPCIDTGDPLSVLDADNSRADMGIYPFLHGTPLMTELVLPGSEEMIDSLGFLSWLKVPNPYQLDTVFYAIQIDDDSLFLSAEIDADSLASGLSDTVQVAINLIDTLGLLEDNTRYFWRVNALNRFGDQSGHTQSREFYYNPESNPPEPFALYNPENDINRVDYYTYFIWGQSYDIDPMSRFDYTLYLSPDSLFNDYVISYPELIDTSLVLTTDLLAIGGGVIYWRVEAIDDFSLVRQGGMPEPQVRKLTILPPGDANCDGLVVGADVSYLVSYFRGITPPSNPLLAGDSNGDCAVIGSDVTYLVQYFRGVGQPPFRGDCEGGMIIGKIGLEAK